MRLCAAQLRSSFSASITQRATAAIMTFESAIFARETTTL
jgi:hypothetical protein